MSGAACRKPRCDVTGARGEYSAVIAGRKKVGVDRDARATGSLYSIERAFSARCQFKARKRRKKESAAPGGGRLRGARLRVGLWVPALGH